TGGSRGAGRGIALVLGEEGATVYVTGRSSRGGPTTNNWPETIDETAEMITARGGVGIPVRVDHADDQQVQALFERVKEKEGKVDILVNNAWGGADIGGGGFDAPFWQQPLSRWDKMLTVGLRSHLVATRLALPLMLPQYEGLIVHTTFAFGQAYYGPVFL